MNPESHDGSATQASLDVQTRNAVIADAAAIEAVHYASRAAVYKHRVRQWPPDGTDRAGRVERWKEWLADESIHCIVAEQDDEIVGFCTVRPAVDEDLRGTSVAEMPTLYIRPDSWRRGHGRTLCQLAVERAADNGFDRLALWVLQINDRARAFYEDFGFSPDGARKTDSGSAEGLMADRFVLELR